MASSKKIVDVIINPNQNLRGNNTESKVVWVDRNTAFLVVHGIGNQNPLETIDQFGQGLLKQLGDDIVVTHHVASKKDKQGNLWMDNYLRLTKSGHTPYIDLYEYYWANYTQDKADFSDINEWLKTVGNGAIEFYKNNEQLGKAYADKSPFFDANGNFNKGLYMFFVRVLSSIIVAWSFVKDFFLKLISSVPVIGQFAASTIKPIDRYFAHQLANVIGDVTVYNTNDEKSKFYPIRRQILDGGVGALRHLIEAEDADGQLSYPKVLVAGHSLGTQVSYDAINKINHLINVGDIANYDATGKYTKNHKTVKVIADQLCGFITFGSPLDKIAFFLDEKVPDTECLRQQMLNSYHGFKQREWTYINSQPKYKVQPAFNRYLESVQWRNYYDKHDYVSGGLDYYYKVTNIDCQFPSKWYGFTHSNYWYNDAFYNDIVDSFIKPNAPLN